MSELKISPELLQISPEVKDALKNKKPVEALESTIFSHKMPFTQKTQFDFLCSRSRFRIYRMAGYDSCASSRMVNAVLRLGLKYRLLDS